MHNANKCLLKTFRIAIPFSVSLLVFPAVTFASAFQVFEQGIISTSFAHADMAAGAYDATTAYYNPAGMTRLERPEISFGGTGIELVTNVRYTPAGPLADDLSDLLKQPLHHSNAEPGGGFFIPNFHAVLPIKRDDWPDIALGLSVVSPFALETNYDGTLAGTYAKQTKEQATLINPSMAIELFDGFSVGGGVDIQQLKSHYSSGVNLLGIYIDADSQVSSWETSWNVGVLYEFTDATRAGVTYRPQINHHETGNVVFESNLEAIGLPDYKKVDATSELDLPATTSFGIFHDLNEQWSLMANAVYTEWSSVQQVVVNNEMPIDIIGKPISKVDVPLDWKNSWFFSGGASYEATEEWTFRGGFGYDRTPTSDDHREMRVPDADRYIFALGLGYEINRYFSVDVGGQYIYTPDVDINNPLLFIDITFPDIGPGIPDLNQAINYTGVADSHAYLIGAQATVKF